MTASEMAATGGPAWTVEDTEAPSLYVLTGGQTRPTHDLQIQTLLWAEGELPPGQPREAEQAVALCRGRPLAVAEIGALIGLPFQITRILMSRLIDIGALNTMSATDSAALPDVALLKALSDALHKL
ncbi:DUF742 domain-containing protein [Streptomyces sp. WI04-05B]|uniref:DUF742 domain-containing protein n=1 Tax=Streptomyces turgidiscabies (strain Car8) TaxID=698760 RepID=L7F3A9_STRT8|nr:MULTISPECIES: DUF742 domain-containing protein [Streptomyces]ELP65817.1 hypothetical protein STRTUCAR8_01688 [Streptomyces turgidiscabies Car8]MDX2548792.1 DUF742 domain-containing protein [Streptomyces sp. WI04-05B]MDX2590369.1 DUF742 domain-containing protein [Streptomyces sp. WI04-05A]MDX3500193.1 DUF742 domain-containing protein [Streptomyces turgidiscabies]